MKTGIKEKSGMKRVAQPINMFRVNVCEEAIERVANVLRSGYIGEGPLVKDLEKSFAKVSGAPWNVAVNSGTSALHLGVILAGVGPGDEVITTAQTMIATSHVILMQHATPVFADIQVKTGNLDPEDIEHRITERTKAILVVHWGGYPCDMEEIHAIAKKFNLVVVEDAAHAIGATYKGRTIGSISPITCFSFQAIKHITSGDGGMLSLVGEENKIEASRLRWFGIDRDLRKPSVLGEAEWNVTRLGFKYQMNDIAAAIALANLNHLHDILSRRREIAKRYRTGLAKVPGITLLESMPDRESAFWLFTLLVDRRFQFLRMLQSKKIYASVVHLRIDRNDLYGGKRQDLPNLDRFTEAHVSLPVHEGLSEDEVEYVIESVKQGW
jgi:perosamine synthetase